MSPAVPWRGIFRDLWFGQLLAKHQWHCRQGVPSSRLLQSPRDIYQGSGHFPSHSFPKIWTFTHKRAVQEAVKPLRKLPQHPSIEGLWVQHTPGGRKPPMADGLSPLQGTSGVPCPLHCTRDPSQAPAHPIGMFVWLRGGEGGSMKQQGKERESKSGQLASKLSLK